MDRRSTRGRPLQGPCELERVKLRQGGGGQRGGRDDGALRSRGVGDRDSGKVQVGRLRQGRASKLG